MYKEIKRCLTDGNNQCSDFRLVKICTGFSEMIKKHMWEGSLQL
jgi:hypothetical protein